MTDSVSQRIEGLSAQLDGLEAAAEGLATDPSVAVSIQRIARSLETSAQALGLTEVAAGAAAIQKAADAHLARSVANFLARIEELRTDGPAADLTILIIEDNRTVAAATQAYVKAPGRRLIIAPSAADGLSILAGERIDVVILDLILPDRDGRDVLVQMREDAKTATVPVIVLSSSAGAVARAECLAVGADEFIEKPAKPKELRSAVSRQIKNGRVRRDAVRDSLTGLPNRAGIIAAFEQHRRNTEREGTDLSVAVISLDPLAEVTMKMGREAGDRFLLEVCAAVDTDIGHGDKLGRWETAELVAILPRHGPEKAKLALKATILALAEGEAMEEFREAGIEVALSAGVTLAGAGQDLRSVISEAERYVYGARPTTAESVGSDGDPLDLPLLRILLVEDDRITATLIRHRLIRDGHWVMDVLNGADAYGWAKEEEFDLAILDVKLPGMDGFELLPKLRAIPHCVDVPIIVLSGMGSETDVIRGLELGADDYMLKPFSPTELLARVRRLLHARAAGKESDAPRTEARA